MKSRSAVLVTAALLAVAVARPAPAQTDWRMTLGILYGMSYAINACGIKATPAQLQKLERNIAYAESNVRMSRAELADIRRRGEVEARKDTRRMCDTIGRDTPRMLQELPADPEK